MIDFQRPGGPFTIKFTLEKDYDVILDVSRAEVFENGKLVKSFSDPAEGDGLSPAAFGYIAHQLETKYPEYLDREKLYINDDPFEREIPVNKVVDALKTEIKEVNAEIQQQYEIIEKAGFKGLISLNDDTSQISKLVEQKYFKDEYREIAQERKQWNTKRDEIAEKERQLKYKGKPGPFNILQRISYNREEKKIQTGLKELNTQQTKIDSMQAILNNKIMKQQGEIGKVTDTLHSAINNIKIDLQIKKETEQVFQHMNKLPDKNQTIGIIGNYKNMGNILEQQENIADQVNSKLQEKGDKQALGHENQFSMAKDIKSLEKFPSSQELFAAYAKECLKESGQAWSEKTNTNIAEKMLKNGVPVKNVKAAMVHSPDKINKMDAFVKELTSKSELKNTLNLAARSR